MFWWEVGPYENYCKISVKTQILCEELFDLIPDHMKKGYIWTDHLETLKV